jgi:rhodanese-related sulfurtransferase
MTLQSCPELPAREALRLASGGAAILDVRDGYEWDAGHAPRATHLPLPLLPTSGTPRSHTGPVMVLCRSGNRARTAACLLRARGVEAFIVSGGMEAWQSAGGPVLRDSGVAGRVA